MTIGEAVHNCQETGLNGWALVEYAQRLVSRQMRYSYTNSYDMPEEAFAKGMGYCWHQASALNAILRELGLDSRLVHAVRNRIPGTVRDGVALPEIISGHVWCRVTVDGEEKDVCPGREENRPGQIHFQPLSKVKEWNRVIAFFSYHGSAMVNRKRYRRFEELRRKQATRWNPEACPCPKTSCPRNRHCDKCKKYHYENNGLPRCERP